MPTPSDTPYIIGVIRFQEQQLLGTDEYTRIIEASSNEDAIAVLADTPYGSWIQEHTATEAMAALEQRLVALQVWLAQTVIDPTILAFLQVRYDSLNVATALLDHQLGKKEIGELSRLGGIDPLLVDSVVVNRAGYEQLPHDWSQFISTQQASLPTINAATAAWKNGLLKRSEEHTIALMQQLSSTDLTRWYTDFTKRLLADNKRRRRVSAPGSPTTTRTATPHLSPADFTSEREWDNELVAHLRQYNADPTGYDPIIAYWLTVELEVKTIRLVLAAKLQGSSPDAIRPLIRHLVHQVA